jgi:hypothetical protein
MRVKIIRIVEHRSVQALNMFKRPRVGTYLGILKEPKEPN